MDSTGRLIPPPVLLGIAAAVVALGSCDRAVEPGPQDDVTAATAPEPEIHVFERLSPVCEACAIHMDPLGEFGNLDDEVLLRVLPRVERDGRGRFLAWVPSARDHEMIFVSGTTHPGLVLAVTAERKPESRPAISSLSGCPTNRA
jgi:hypothetical protein